MASSDPNGANCTPQQYSLYCGAPTRPAAEHAPDLSAASFSSLNNPHLIDDAAIEDSFSTDAQLELNDFIEGADDDYGCLLIDISAAAPGNLVDILSNGSGATVLSPLQDQSNIFNFQPRIYDKHLPASLRVFDSSDAPPGSAVNVQMQCLPPPAPAHKMPMSNHQFDAPVEHQSLLNPKQSTCSFNSHSPSVEKLSNWDHQFNGKLAVGRRVSMALGMPFASAALDVKKNRIARVEELGSQLISTSEKQRALNQSYGQHQWLQSYDYLQYSGPDSDPRRSGGILPKYSNKESMSYMELKSLSASTSNYISEPYQTSRRHTEAGMTLPTDPVSPATPAMNEEARHTLEDYMGCAYGGNQFANMDKLAEPNRLHMPRFNMDLRANELGSQEKERERRSLVSYPSTNSGYPAYRRIDGDEVNPSAEEGFVLRVTKQQLSVHDGCPNLSAPVSPATPSMNVEAQHKFSLHALEHMGHVHGGHQFANKEKTGPNSFQMAGRTNEGGNIIKKRKQARRSDVRCPSNKGGNLPATYQITVDGDELTSPGTDDGVVVRVKTQQPSLHDGYAWKKYGEKAIKNDKHTRHYWRCDEKKRRGCPVVKRTQKCSHDEEYVDFFYFGRHNHHPA